MVINNISGPLLHSNSDNRWNAGDLEYLSLHVLRYFFVTSKHFIISFLVSPPVYFVNGLILSLVGFFVAGPANMISSVVSADLGMF